MNEFELIAAMLDSLNRRLEALECDSEGRGSQGKDFRELRVRFAAVNDAMAKHLKKAFPK